MMKKLLAQCDLVDFYFAKIEQYLGRKHQNIIHKSNMSSCSDSIYSGSPKSTISDRVNTLEDDERKNDEEFGDHLRTD